MTDTATDTATDAAQPKKVCIVGGGASGVGLLWCLAKAQQLGLTTDKWVIRLIHDDANVGGHSRTVTVQMNGKPVELDTGVQMIAPAMYPGLSCMLDLPEFAPVELQHVDLRIACAFPPTDAATPYWGNFPAYQSTDLYKQGAAAASVFQTLLSAASLKKDPVELAETVRQFLDKNAAAFPSPTALKLFTDYFLDPYMSIMNGYGAARLGTTALVDIAALWDLGFASFTEATEGYARFAHGAQSWVKQMADLAKSQFGPGLQLTLNSSVTQIYPGTTGAPVVMWVDNKTKKQSLETFDMVVSTLDMQTNSGVFNNPNNKSWATVYEPRIGVTAGQKSGTTVWPLIPGYCYVHQDASVLAPGMPQPSQETLQVTASYAGDGHGGYDLVKSYTTYVESNLLGIKLTNPSDEWYLTMYGFDPSDYGIKPPSTKIPAFDWVHGMWMPTFMLSQKLAFHTAQGISQFHPARPGQQATGIFFTGNNLTMDSEEGALMSGLCLAKYAFGIDATRTLLPPPVPLGNLKTWAIAVIEFEALYELMFPSALLDPTSPANPSNPSSVLRSLESVMARFLPLRR